MSDLVRVGWEHGVDEIGIEPGLGVVCHLGCARLLQRTCQPSGCIYCCGLCR